MSLSINDREAFNVSSGTDSEGEFAKHQTAKSPAAPKVIRGGNDDEDFFQVAHLASIEINQTAFKPSPVESGYSSVQLRRPSSSPASEASLADSQDDEKGEEGNDDERMLPVNANPDPNVKDEPDQDLDVITSIEKSPYEADCDAEKGENIFDFVKEVLQGDENGDPKERALAMFGPTNAKCIIRAHDLIDRSGMVWGNEWINGNFRGDQLGTIPPELLLICLIPNRGARADYMTFSRLCKGTKLYAIINRALDEWGLAEDFIRIRAFTENYKFTAKVRDCFKCAIFVARLFCCCKLPGVPVPSDRLLAKAKACLEIMELNLPDPSSAKMKKAKAPDHIPSASATRKASESSSEKPTSGKKKRGRSSKTSQTPPPPPIAAAAAATASVTSDGKKKRKGEGATKPVCYLEEPEEDGEEEVIVVRSTTSRGRRSSTSGGKTSTTTTTTTAATTSASSSTPSMQRLILRFEEQYDEMGKRYQEMGTLLQQMKAAAASGRERTEEEIRADVLEEVQRTIMKSLPKK